MGTNTTTIRTITTMLNTWLNETEPPELYEIAPEASEHLKQALIDQQNIGWDQWFRGRISIKWGELYNHDILKPNILSKHLLKYPLFVLVFSRIRFKSTCNLELD
jgi:hypothetical protein